MRLRNRYLISPDQPIDSSELATQDATSTNSSSESDDVSRMDADAINGNAEVTIGGRSYPAPNRYDEGDWLEDQDLCARAPWFDKAALEDPDGVAVYAVDGWLPGELPLRAIRTWCWEINSQLRITTYLLVAASRSQLCEPVSCAKRNLVTNVFVLFGWFPIHVCSSSGRMAKLGISII